MKAIQMCMRLNGETKLKIVVAYPPTTHNTENIILQSGQRQGSMNIAVIFNRYRNVEKKIEILTNSDQELVMKGGNWSNDAGLTTR